MTPIINPFFGLIAVLVLIGFFGGAPLWYLWGRSDQKYKDQKSGIKEAARREKARQSEKAFDAEYLRRRKSP